MSASGLIANKSGELTAHPRVVLSRQFGRQATNRHCPNWLRRGGPKHLTGGGFAAHVDESEACSYQGISCRLRKNFPVNSCGASLANQTAVSAPSSTEIVAFGPP